MAWLEFFEQVGLFGIIGLVFKSIITHWLDKDVAKYHSSLQHTHNIALEKLRTDLSIRSIEHEIRFRSIHEKQAEILAETYSLLYQLQEVVASYVAISESSGEPTKKEKLKIVADASENFRTYFYPRKIFFPYATGESTSALANKLTEITNVFAIGQIIQDGTVAYWGKTNKLIKEEIPPLLNQLEQEFQRLLGVDEAG